MIHIQILGFATLWIIHHQYYMSKFIIEDNFQILLVMFAGFQILSLHLLKSRVAKYVSSQKFGEGVGVLIFNIPTPQLF
jgi:membrane protein implicated in regulation of membrane protease activity